MVTPATVLPAARALGRIVTAIPRNGVRNGVRNGGQEQSRVSGMVIGAAGTTATADEMVRHGARKGGEPPTAE